MLNVSDGVEKALILIPTQPLLAQALVAPRRKHRAHPESMPRARVVAGPGYCRNSTSS